MFDVLQLRFSLFTIMLLASAASLAQHRGYGELAAHAKVRQIDYQEVIASDYTSIRTIAVEQEALSNDGAVMIGRYSVTFNSDLESIEILQAYTGKADGRKIPVQPEQIDRQTGMLAPDSQISMPGVHVIQLTFPNVQKGDTTYVQYRQHVKKPALAQWLSNFGTMLNTIDIEAFKLRVTAPKSLNLQVHAQGLSESTWESAEERHWALEGASKSFATPASWANGLKNLPHWMYSTLGDRKTWAEKFTGAMREKLVITSEIQTLANQIIKGKVGEFDKAKAIYEWMGREMRYVAIFLGSGGFVPNALPEILKNRYGDCKDQTLLMMALLQAVGIESAPVLINAVHSDTVPPLAVAGMYSHVMVYIPALATYADPTAASKIAFGKLPWVAMARPVVIGLRSGAREMRTPAYAALDNRVEVKSTWTLDARGAAEVDLRIKTLGQAATEMQDQLSQIPPGFSGSAVQRFLKNANLKGKGFLQYPAVDRSLQEQNISAQLQLSEFLPTPDAGSISPHPTISSLPVYIGANLGPQADADWRFDMLCTPISIEEEFELNFQPGMQLLSVPSGVAYKGAGLTYASSYRQQGSRIVGQRRFEREPTASGHVCSPGEVLARLPLLNAIRKDLHSSVLFKSP